MTTAVFSGAMEGDEPLPFDTTYLVHPVADLFPMLAEDELDELAADIKQRGLLQPLVLDGEGRILDGRNRLAACRLAGVEPRFTTYDGDDAAGFALAINGQRREMSKRQKATLGAVAILSSSLELEDQKVALALGVSKSSLSEALVLAPYKDLAGLVLSGAKPFNTALDEARARDRAEEEAQSNKARLRSAAPDLLALAEDERMSFDDAIGALEAREQKARQEMDAEKQREHQRSVEQARDIETARAKAAALLADLQANVVAIRLGAEYGAEGLVTKKMLAELRRAVDLLEEIL